MMCKEKTIQKKPIKSVDYKKREILLISKKKNIIWKSKG
jgi:hypothetical protein